MNSFYSRERREESEKGRKGKGREGHITISPYQSPSSSWAFSESKSREHP
jgi:hypothetical protein